MVEELAGFGGGSIASSAVIELAEGPPGWVVIIGAIISSVAMSMIFKKVAEISYGE